MSYINGKNLHIFPSSSRTAQPEDNWLSEYNLSSIINQFLDSGSNGCSGFVISSTAKSGQPFEFNIAGYYFKVDDLQNIIDAAKEDADSPSSFVAFSVESGAYRATIYLSGDNPPKLLGADDSSKVASGNIQYSLVLFKSADSGYEIPPTSRLSVVGLTSLSGQGAQIAVKGGEITSCTIEAADDGNGNSFKIENGKLTNLNFNFRDEDEKNQIKIENGKLTAISLADISATGTISDAVNVTSTINGKSIGNIFESNGTTVKKATYAASAGKATQDGSGSIITSTYARKADVYTKEEVTEIIQKVQSAGIDDGELE